MNKILAVAVIGLLVLGVASPAYAHEGHDHTESTANALEDAKKRADEAKEKLKAEAESTRESIKQKREELKARFKTHKEQIQYERDELKQKITASRTENKQKLADKRLELCQKKQDKINGHIEASAKFGRERLARIQSVEERVKEFYDRQQLSSSEYETAVILVDEKEAAAIAAIELVETQSFDCTKVDATKPSGEIKELHKAKFEALNVYRDSVKQLIQIVKSAASDATDEGSAQ